MRQELVQKYVDYHHLHYIKGSSADMSVLMPYLIMDVGYQYYCHDILPMKLKREIKLARRKWSDCYLAFNKELTAPYDNDELIEVTDLIDAMHDTLGNDLMILQVAAMRVFEKDFDFNQQKILSSIFMTNKLAVIAQNTWRVMFRKENNNLNGVMEWSREFSDYYMRSLGKTECLVSEDSVKELTKCANILIDKIVKWLTEQNAREVA